MTTIENMKYEERKEFAARLNNWLSHYTAEVLKRVAPRFEEIASNEFAMNLLKELKDREEAEEIDEIHTIETLLWDIENEQDHRDLTFDCYHNHPLEHAKAYRDILYDMYIRG